ncbi:MAG: DNA polymerase III subunit delta [Caldithrix sp.]|nr:DNA polymerase III subunit delta [Caldithrix sp.]
MIKQIINDISNHKIANLYFLYGREKFFHDQIIKILSETLLPDKADRDLNLSVFYGSEHAQKEIMASCYAYPMFSKQRLVIVKDFDLLKISDPDALINYIQNPQSTTVLLLSATNKGRSKITQTLDKHSIKVECKPIPEYKLDNWLIQRCKDRGGAIEPAAAHFLIQQVGSSLLSLDQELHKITDFKNDNSRITVDDIEQVTGITREISIFALQNMLGKRDLASSLKICNALIESGESALAINAILFAYFRKLLMVSSLKNRGFNRNQIMNQLHLADFQVRDFLKASTNFTINQLERIIDGLTGLDMAVKTSARPEESGLQMICYKICRT